MGLSPVRVQPLWTISQVDKSQRKLLKIVYESHPIRSVPHATFGSFVRYQTQEIRASAIDPCTSCIRAKRHNAYGNNAS